MAPPVNDDFADAEVLTGTSDSYTGTNVDATLETDEAWFFNGETVWHKWTAPVGDRLLVTIEVTSPDFDPYVVGLSNEIGDTFDDVQLSYVYDTDDPALFRFWTVPGRIYYFVVDDTDGLTGAYTIDLTSEDPDNGDVCATAKTWEFGAHPIPHEPNSTHYAVTVPSGSRVYETDRGVGRGIGGSDGTYIYFGGWYFRWVWSNTGGADFVSGNATYRIHKRYDPATDTWSDLTYPNVTSAGNPARLHPACGGVFSDKIVWVTWARGREGLDATVLQQETWVYDIAGDSWSAGATPPAHATQSTIKVPVVSAIDGRKLYGISVNNAGTVFLDVYDVDTDTWTAKTAPPAGMRPDLLSQGAALGGKIHFLSFPADDQEVCFKHYVYDIAGDSWVTETDPPLLTNREDPFSADSVSLVSDGVAIWAICSSGVFVIGANQEDGVGVGAPIADIVAQYDAVAEEWCFGPHSVNGDSVLAGAQFMPWQLGLIDGEIFAVQGDVRDHPDQPLAPSSEGALMFTEPIVAVLISTDTVYYDQLEAV